MNPSLLIFLTIVVSIQCQTIKCGVRVKGLQKEAMEVSTSGDDFSPFGEFPWLVGILEKITHEDKQIRVYRCSGTILHPKVVLTSADCVIGKKHFSVRAGEWDVITQNEILPYQEHNVAEVVIYPEYNESKKSLNNLALLVLAEPFNLMDHINTICLPSHDEILENSGCVVSGWRTGGFGVKENYLTIVKQLKLPIVQRDDCIKRVGQHFNVSETFVCAGGELEQKKCISDEGAALVCPIPGKKNEYYQRGILAWGFACGNTDIPYVYHNVASFRNWIDSEMKKLNLGSTSYTY